MGATTYKDTYKANSARDAFDIAVNEAMEDARWDGDEGCFDTTYAGTIVTASSFTMVEIPEGQEADALIEKILWDPDCRFHKWSELAGCVDNKDGTYTFFGWAPC